MHVTRRSLLAAAAGATCATLLPAQVQQKGVIVGQTRSPTENLPTSLGGKTLKQWIAEISSPDPSRRENAIRTVPHMKDAEQAVPALIERIERDADSSPRVSAIMALGAVPISKEDEPKAMAALARRVTDDTQSIIRFQAALVLGRFGGKARQYMKQLIGATKDLRSWEIRKAGVFALYRTAADREKYVDSQALEALIDRLSPGAEPSAMVRLEAVMSVTTIGLIRPADNIKLVSGLRRAEEDRERMISIWARVGLCVHDNKLTEKDIKILIGFLGSKDLPQRTHAARALGTIASVGNPGTLINPAVPPLIKMLDDPEQLGQVAAIWALGQIGAPAKAALKPLNEMLKDKQITEEGKGFVREAINMIERRVKN